MAEDTTPRELELLDLSDIMAGINGRNVLRRILTSTGYFDSTLNDDPTKSLISSARRDVGVQLYSEMKEASAPLLDKLLQEYNDG